MNIIISKNTPLPSAEKLLEAITKGLVLTEQDAKIVGVCTKALEVLKNDLEHSQNKDAVYDRLKVLKKSALTSCVQFVPTDNGFKVVPIGLIALAKFGWVAKEDLMDLERRIQNQLQTASVPSFAIDALPQEIPLPSRNDLDNDDQELLSNLIDSLPNPELENFPELLKLAKAQLKEYVIFSLDEPKTGHNQPSIRIRPLGCMALQSCGFLDASDKEDLKAKTFQYINQSYINLRNNFLNGDKAKKHVDFLQATSADNVGDFTERFELSLEPHQPTLAIQEWTNRFAVPHVGVYGNEGTVYKAGDKIYNYYQWSPPIVLMRLPNALIWETIPDNVRTTLEKLGYKASAMNNHESVQCHLNISGNPFYFTGPEGTTLQSPKGYNISFHSSIFPQNSKGGSSKPLVGIFDLYGVDGGNIPVNNVEEREVYLHEDASRASSPDNISFKMTGPVAIFWSLGIDIGKVIISAHMVFNDDKLEKKVREASSRSKNINELLVNLRDSGLPPESLQLLQRIL